MAVSQYLVWVAVLLMSIWLVACTSTSPSVAMNQSDPLFKQGQTYDPDDVLCTNERGGLYFVSAR